MSFVKFEVMVTICFMKCCMNKGTVLGKSMRFYRFLKKSWDTVLDKVVFHDMRINYKDQPIATNQYFIFIYEDCQVP